jgi:EAL domain-containing protein (putative c-di-GMP-specific phosphodiesterase class I)
MLHALCSYAHDLGSKVGATGVEDEATRQILCELGFDAVQGRLFNPLDYGAPRVRRVPAG